MYIPRDEDVVHLKFKILLQKLKSMFQGVSPKLQSEHGTNFIQDEFQSFDDVFNLYNDQGGRFPVPKVIEGTTNHFTYTFNNM